MVTYDRKEIEILKAGGKILAQILNEVAKAVEPGISAGELNELAEKLIGDAGAMPSFKNYQPIPGGPIFPAALCVSVNDEVVHGIPYEKKILKEGDIVGLDLGVEYRGLYTDMAVTVPVGNVDSKLRKLIDTSQLCLTNAIKAAKLGNFTGDIGFAIESTAKQSGFSVVRELVGHGVGREIHEEPEVPCFGKPKTGTKLVEGMVLAIEPMVNEGGFGVAFGPDRWTVKTADHSHSAHFEHTVLITKSGCEVLTNML